jgi:hypothetical protein
MISAMGYNCPMNSTGQNSTEKILSDLSGMRVLIVSPYFLSGMQAVLAGTAVLLNESSSQVRFLQLDLPMRGLIHTNFLRRIQNRLQVAHQNRFIENTFRKLQIPLDFVTSKVQADLTDEELLRRVQSCSTLAIAAEEFSEFVWIDSLLSEMNDLIPAAKLLSDDEKVLMVNLILDFQRTTKIVSDYLQSNNQIHFDCVVTVNGRFCATNAIIETAKENGLVTIVAETGAFMNWVQLFEVSVHSMAEWQSKVSNDWNHGPSTDHKTAVGKAWIERNRNPIQNPYVSAQTLLKSLPGTNKKRLVFFPSSDSETSPYVDVRPDDFFKDQFEAFDALLATGTFDDWEIVVRCHPKIANTRVEATRDDFLWNLRKAKYNLVIIKSLDDVDSYALAESSTLIAGFETQFTMEAIYLGVPTIIMANTPFSHLVPNNLFRSKTELLNLDIDTLRMTPRDSVVPFGYHQTVRGKRNPLLVNGPIVRSQFEKIASEFVRLFNTSSKSYKNE